MRPALWLGCLLLIASLPTATALNTTDYLFGETPVGDHAEYVRDTHQRYEDDKQGFVIGLVEGGYEDELAAHEAFACRADGYYLGEVHDVHDEVAESPFHCDNQDDSRFDGFALADAAITDAFDEFDRVPERIESLEELVAKGVEVADRLKDAGVELAKDGIATAEGVIDLILGR